MNQIITFFYNFTHFIKNIIEKSKNIDFSLSKKHIVILIGDSGLYISVFWQGKLVDCIFIQECEYDSNKDINFLQRFPAHRVFFVLDTSDVELNHADILAPQEFIYHNPLTKFIDTKFDKEILVSSNVYNITKSDQDIYNSVFASTKVSPILAKLLDYTSYNGFDVNGVYFFSLNAPLIIDNILAETLMQEQKNPLYIFITVLATSKIRILILSKDNVMDSKTISYPEEKGDSYIQGVIEQSVIDALISLKNHMHHNKVEPLLMIVTHNSLKNLLIQSNFNIKKTIILSNEDFKNIKSNPKNSKPSLSDGIISYFLNKKTHYHASNAVVTEFLNLKRLNKFLSTPWYIFIFILLSTLVFVGIQNIMQENETQDINNKFYLLSENYRKLRKEYPKISNLEDVVSFYYAEKSLIFDQKLPFDILKTLLKSVSSNFTINTIQWEYLNQQSVIISNIRYQTSSSFSIENAIKQLNKEIDSLRIVMPEQNISFTYDKNTILNSNNIITIYLKLYIKW